MRSKHLHTITFRRTGQKVFVILALASAAAVGCTSGLCACGTAPKKAPGPSTAETERVSREASGVFGDKPAPGPSSTGAGAWKIALATAPADADDISTMQLLGTVRAQTGLTGARLEKRGKALVVTYGAYASASDPAAQEQLARARGLVVGGAKPYAAASMIPPAYSGMTGSDTEMNLATLKQRYGERAAYTLQIAAYERNDGKDATPEDLAEIRRAAEAAATQLRTDGEEAFYYHGPRRSMVTVGVFSEKEFDTSRPGRESPALRVLKEKYKFNLVNGAPIRVRTRANPEGVVQPSFVVAVPE